MAGHVRLKTNGAGYWQAFCGGGFPSGKKTITLGAKSQLCRRDAWQRCRELDYQMRNASLDAASQAPRLSAWLERYDQQRTRLSKGTREVNRFAGEYLKRFFTTDPAIDRITHEQAANWRAALATGALSDANKKHKTAPGEQTVCKYVRAIRRIFNEAKKQRLLNREEGNPFDCLDGTPPRPIRDWAYLNPADMQRVFDACPNDDWRAFFALCRFAGLRRGEAWGLRWQDVNFATNRMVVGMNSPNKREDTKHRDRTVPIDPSRCVRGLAAILQTALANAQEGAVRVCHRVNWSNIDTRARKIITTAGIPAYDKIHNTLRKNCAMDWAACYPQHAVSEWMGHSITVAGRHYLKVTEELYAAASPASLAPPDLAQTHNQK